MNEIQHHRNRVFSKGKNPEHKAHRMQLNISLEIM